MQYYNRLLDLVFAIIFHINIFHSIGYSFDSLFFQRSLPSSIKFGFRFHSIFKYFRLLVSWKAAVSSGKTLQHIPQMVTINSHSLRRRQVASLWRAFIDCVYATIFQTVAATDEDAMSGAWTEANWCNFIEFRSKCWRTVVCCGQIVAVLKLTLLPPRLPLSLLLLPLPPLLPLLLLPQMLLLPQLLLLLLLPCSLLLPCCYPITTAAAAPCCCPCCCCCCCCCPCCCCCVAPFSSAATSAAPLVTPFAVVLLLQNVLTLLLCTLLRRAHELNIISRGSD